MSDKKFSAIRARLKYETLAAFKAGYSKFVSTGGMFIPVPEKKLKPVGTVIRFQFLLSDGSTALLGEGTVLQVREPSTKQPRSPVGMLIKFSKLSPESKSVVDAIVASKDEHKTPTQEVRETMPTPVGQVPAESRDIAPEPYEEDKTYEMSVDQFAAMQQEAEQSESEPITANAQDPFSQPEPASSLEAATSPAQDMEPSELSATTNDIRSELAPTPLDEVPPASTAGRDDITPTEDDIFGDDEEPVALPAEPLDELSSEPVALPAEPLDEPSDPPSAPVALPAEPLDEPSDPPSAPVALPAEPLNEPSEASANLVEESEEILALDPIDESEVKTALDEPSQGAVRVLSYDDMSAVEGAVDFGFSGEESEIDDMFDDLFGAAGDSSFFDEVLGTAEDYESLAEEDLISEVSEAEQVEPTVVPVPDPDVSQDVSLDDVFGDSDASEDEPEIVAEADNTVSDIFTQPEDLNPFREPENPFREPEPEPIIPIRNEDPTEDVGGRAALLEHVHKLESDAPEQPLFDLEEEFADEPEPVEESEPLELGEPIEETPEPVSEPVFEAFDDDEEEEPEPEPALFEAFDAEENEPFSAEPELAPEPPSSGSNAELDNLFEHLNDDVPVGTSLELNLGAEEEPPAPDPEQEEESLEALLALANRDIENKREEETKQKESEDIFDQLLGDDLPPPPSDSPAFMPTPDLSKKEKKGFFSKLLKKD